MSPSIIGALVRAFYCSSSIIGGLLLDSWEELNARIAMEPLIRFVWTNDPLGFGGVMGHGF